MSENRKYPLVSIISINYNQSAVTVEFLKSISRISYPAYEIIVVDNGSIPPIEKKPLPIDCKLIYSKKNLGFAGGNNLAIKSANGEYCLLINNDTEVDNEFLEPLVELMESNKNIGIVSPKILYFGSNVLQYAGYTKINPISGRNKTIGMGKEDMNLYTTASPTYYPHGAAMLVRRDAIKAVGLMPEEYFLYYEELAWGELFRRKGFEIFFSPQSVVYHKESQSIGKLSPLKEYYISRNRILFMRKNYKGLNLLLFYMFLLLFSVPKTLITKCINREFTQLKAYLKGVMWNVNESYR